jgi:hypothetical protein
MDNIWDYLKVDEIARTNHPNGEPIEMAAILGDLKFSEEASLLVGTMG